MSNSQQVQDAPPVPPATPATPTTPATTTRTQDIMLLEFLREHDAACPVCGYNVRALTRPICPECRQQLVLTVGAARLRLGWLFEKLGLHGPEARSRTAAVSRVWIAYWSVREIDRRSCTSQPTNLRGVDGAS